MELLSSVGAVSAVMKGASSIVKQLKGSKPQQSSFADLLQKDLAKIAVMGPQKDAKTRSESYMRSRDVDANGSLSRAESGFGPDSFKKWDLDKSGDIGAAELLGAFTNNADITQ